MLRHQAIAAGFGNDGSVRWRGEIARIEGFSDCVFGFALTLIVVSLDVPQTFNDLVGSLSGIPAFAICFGVLFRIWYAQFQFFRRFGLQDILTVTLNGVLLFTVVSYVYPLKFLFTIALGEAPSSVQTPAGVEPVITDSQFPLLFVIYGVGYAAITLLFALLYANAYRQRRQLELTPAEEYATRTEILVFLLEMCVPLLSIALALVVPPTAVSVAGWIYFLIAVARGSVFIARRSRKVDPASAAQ